MRNCSYPLIIAAMMAVGCSSKTEVVRPVIEYVTIEKYVPIPDEHLKPCTATHGKDRSVKEYVRVANTNTPRLVQCGEQIEAIRKLQPEE